MTLEETLARAIAAAFWRQAEQPRPWDAHSHLARQVWLECARDAIAAGKAYRERRAAA